MQRSTRILGNKVTPLSSEFIRENASIIRRACCSLVPSIGNKVDVLGVLDKLHNLEFLTFEVVENDEMPGEYALTIPSQKRIIVRNDTYLSAFKGESRGRFTLAHELGHFFLHANTVPQFARSQVPSNHCYTEDVEWQANEFAAWMLVDQSDRVNTINPGRISRAFGVSMETASIVWRKLKG
ncbi:ImmA/IrrE family metallo-endopeptidase [Serratia fonticola]